MSGSGLWGLIIGCALLTGLLKGIGPMVLGGRELPVWFGWLVAAMAPALLTALVVTVALADGQRVQIGAETAGVAVAGLVAWWRGSMVWAVLAAVVVTAGLRLLA